MLNISVPGKGDLLIKNVVFDYNGTLAVDGIIEDKIKQKLIEMTDFHDIYILTSDTYGTVSEECRELGIEIITCSKEKAALDKKNYVSRLGGQETICVGNGVNDIEMFKVSRISFAIMGKEGVSAQLLAEADVVFHDIEDALSTLFSPQRLKATLRN